MTTLHLLLPPIIGGVIGYFTNYVAIKMLFRPKKAYYLFGKKLPFTPGLIPAKREKLAVSIAKVVKENLLTEETIKKRLNEEKVRNSIQSLINSSIDSFLKDSDKYIRDILNKFGDKKPLDFFPFNTRDIIEKLLQRIENSNKKIIEILPPEIIEEKENMAIVITEKLFEIIEEKAESPEFEIKLALKIQRFLEETIKLPDVVIFKKPLKSMAFTISNKIISIMEETLKNREFKESTVDYIKNLIENLANKKISEMITLNDKDRNKIASLISGIVENEQNKTIKEILDSNPLITKRITDLIKERIEFNRDPIVDKISLKLLEVIEKELPVILDSLDIENMIIDKVNSLPIEEVEGIILKLIEEELKYITLLGGVLGVIIGAFQNVILLLG